MGTNKDTGNMDIPYGEAPERILIDTGRITGNVDSAEDLVAVKAVQEMPREWLNLIQAIALMSKHATSDISPFQCSHDQLSVQSDWMKYTKAEILQLDEWGFHVDHEYGGFYSFRYGSA